MQPDNRSTLAWVPPSQGVRLFHGDNFFQPHLAHRPECSAEDRLLCAHEDDFRNLKAGTVSEGDGVPHLGDPPSYSALLAATFFPTTFFPGAFLAGADFFAAAVFFAGGAFFAAFLATPLALAAVFLFVDISGVTPPG